MKHVLYPIAFCYLKLFYRAKWISVHGTKYKCGAIVHIGFDEDEFPQFWEIKEISIIDNNVAKAMFIVTRKETLRFSEHYQAYEIAMPRQKNTRVFYSKDFTCHLPLHQIKPFRCQAKYVCLRYEIDIE